MLEGDPKGDSQSILKHKINLQYPTILLPKSIFLLLCLVCPGAREISHFGKCRG